MMGKDSELEEGELNCSTNEAIVVDLDVDLDVDLSYIDKKVENVLGNLQKDFGERALELFSPKICDYGSFLPTYKHSPAVPLCQRSSLGNHVEQRFSNNLPGKNVVQKFQPLPTTTSCKLVAINQNPQTYHTSGSLLAQAPEKVPIRNGVARILPGNGLSDHKPLRLRIKMGSETLSQKRVTLVCNDLGLNDSPNSTSRNSHDDSSRMLPHTSLEKTSESLSHILQEMTAITVPEDLLMSPIPDSLILVKDKEKNYTLLKNQPVLKVGKEPSIETQNKFSSVLPYEETPRGRRRKLVDCFGATTGNETSSIGEMKKQKLLSTSQVAREKNSTCGVGGEISTNDGLKTKNNLRKVIKRESDPGVAFAKSNKRNVVGKHSEMEKKTCPTKLKQNSIKNRLGDNFLSKMPLKDTTDVGQTVMDTKVDFAVAPSSTSLDLDNWVQCDRCEKWRLLPFGLNPDQLPEKWLCSMQTWLPGMNHCSFSEEETKNAIISFHASEAHGPETGVKILSDASNADRSYQPLTCGSLPCPVENKSNVKEFSQGVSSNILGDTAKPMKSNSRIYKIKGMKLPIETPNATQISTKNGVSHTFVQDNVDRKTNSRSAGTGRQIKIMKKKVGDEQDSDGSMHIKTGNGNKLARDIKAEEIHWNQDQEWTPAERKTKRHDTDFYTSDVEQNTKKRVLASKKKPDDKPQVTSGSGSLCPLRKLRLMGQNGNNLKSYTDGEEKEALVEKAITTKISVQECKAHQTNELFEAGGSQEHRNADASCRYFSGGSGQISGVETSSSSKVFGSHKSGRMCGEEVKASPVESVSSSPARSSCPKKFPSAGASILRKDQNLKYGDDGRRIANNRIPLSQEADCEILSTTHSGNRKQPKPEVCKQNSEFGDLPCTSRKTVLESRAGVKNFGASTHETMDRSSQAASDILQEAESLRKLAECFKSSGFDYKYNKKTFKAALGFLRGASLLERCSTENVEGGKMSHVEAYHTAAKLSESCAHQYETSQEMAAAALAYKCTEVACMRVVYGRSLALSGEWKEFQTRVHMTPEGESPSSSASDVDSFNHQGVTDKSAKTKRGLFHVAGNLRPVVPLVDFAETMNMAMEASAKSQNAFKAASVTSEETKHGDCISAIKKVIDFSFHDVEALIQMIEVAMNSLSSSRIGGPKS